MSVGFVKNKDFKPRPPQRWLNTSKTHAMEYKELIAKREPRFSDKVVNGTGRDKPVCGK